MHANNGALVGVLYLAQGQADITPGLGLTALRRVFIFVKQGLYTWLFDLLEVVFCHSGSDNAISKMWSVAPTNKVQKMHQFSDMNLLIAKL